MKNLSSLNSQKYYIIFFKKIPVKKKKKDEYICPITLDSYSIELSQEKEEEKDNYYEINKQYVKDKNIFD